VKAGHWTSAMALLGVGYRLPLASKLSLVGRVELGVAESWSPTQAVTGFRAAGNSGPSELIQASVHSVSATSFTALAGAGVSYQCSSRWSIIAGADYSYLKPSFHNVTAGVIDAQDLIIPGVFTVANAAQWTYQSRSANLKQAMPTLNITVGVSRTL
jgi:hypothetical protein